MAGNLHYVRTVLQTILLEMHKQTELEHESIEMGNSVSASTVRSQTFSVRAILKMKKDMYHLKLLSTSKSPVALRSQNLNLLSSCR